MKRLKGKAGKDERDGPLSGYLWGPGKPSKAHTVLPFLTILRLWILRVLLSEAGLFRKGSSIRNNPMGIYSGTRIKQSIFVALASLVAVPFLTPAALAQPFTYNVVQTDLPAINYGSVAFADLDRDGDMDVAMSGSTVPVAPFLSTSHIGLNLRTSPVQARSILPFEMTELPTTTFLGELSWIDFDNDGDLDLSQTRSSSEEALVEPVS